MSQLYELSKNYSECLNNYLNPENNNEFDEDVFTWLQYIFTAFSRKNKFLTEDDLKNLQKAFIDKVDLLSKISVVKTNKIIKQFYGNSDKIIIIHKLDKIPSLQYEFLNQLICHQKGVILKKYRKMKTN